MEHVISDECLASIRRTGYEAGASGREVYTSRGPDGPEVVRCRDCKYAKAFVSNPIFVACRRFESYDYVLRMPTFRVVERDGFCAWGKKAER